MRSITTAPTLVPVPFPRQHQRQEQQWRDLSHMTSLVDFYMELISPDAAVTALHTFYDLMPDNISLLIRCVLCYIGRMCGVVCVCMRVCVLNLLMCVVWVWNFRMKQCCAVWKLMWKKWYPERPCVCVCNHAHRPSYYGDVHLQVCGEGRGGRTDAQGSQFVCQCHLRQGAQPPPVETVSSCFSFEGAVLGCFFWCACVCLERLDLWQFGPVSSFSMHGHACMLMSMWECVCVRACVRACMRVCASMHMDGMNF